MGYIGETTTYGAMEYASTDSGTTSDPALRHDGVRKALGFGETPSCGVMESGSTEFAMTSASAWLPCAARGTLSDGRDLRQLTGYETMGPAG